MINTEPLITEKVVKQTVKIVERPDETYERVMREIIIWHEKIQTSLAACPHLENGEIPLCTKCKFRPDKNENCLQVKLFELLDEFNEVLK